jgi:hypothetical protein
VTSEMTKCFFAGSAHTRMDDRENTRESRLSYYRCGMSHALVYGPYK